ncbi:hypothetical protein [Iningainema tapete]|uniref:Uncharacterized protein n=1 Tax=Iningainema tapete BLCC-T55 TaxID=2748662 RepID=A0A8J7C6Z5_9CYAN|nr:hypothetical protein [Iningainema tapete]MBD2774989.1 hypothetical protein [Iningainema tapete BLCC-T55]
MQVASDQALDAEARILPSGWAKAFLKFFSIQQELRKNKDKIQAIPTLSTSHSLLIPQTGDRQPTASLVIVVRSQSVFNPLKFLAREEK